MNVAAWALLALAIVASVCDWCAVHREWTFAEYVAKPLATIGFLAVVLSIDVPHDAVWVWRIIALVFCLFGDVFLMLPQNMFVPGLGSFAVAQVLFAVSFAVGETATARWIVATVVAIPAAALLARRFIRAIRSSGHNELVVPVSVYVVVITAMAVAATASGSIVAIVGALVFMLSDSLIAETRFVRERSWHAVSIMVTYHAALAGLSLSLL